jgi:hypothetical protein
MVFQSNRAVVSLWKQPVPIIALSNLKALISGYCPATPAFLLYIDLNFTGKL